MITNIIFLLKCTVSNHVSVNEKERAKSTKNTINGINLRKKKNPEFFGQKVETEVQCV